MSMLNDFAIRQMVFPNWEDAKRGASRVAYVPESRELQFGPIRDEQIQPASLDVRLSSDFISHPEGLDFNVMTSTLTLVPGECVLGCLVEQIAMPDNVVARVEGKSSLARKFLTVHAAGFIDPGFKGDITLELKNDGEQPIRLSPGMLIAQISFQFLVAPAVRTYGSPELNSHYWGQTGPTASRA